MVYSVRLDRSAGAAHEPAPAKPVSTAAERARQLTKPFGADDALDAWAARLIADSEDFQNRKRSDPLGGFLR
jgi:hypothetical protein